MENTVKFKPFDAKTRTRSMLRVDCRRMLRSSLFYILIAISLVIPILMTVMMTMMDGSVSVDPQTGVETVIEGPENAWQSIGTLPTDGGAAMGGMDVMAMCNINMMFMLVAVFVCLNVSEDFKSGYAKNLFTVRAKKSDYVLSKTVIGFICGSLMIIAYFAGSMLGGAIASLSFETLGFSAANAVFCLLCKLLLMLVFVPIFTLIAIAAKHKTWISVCGSLGGGMLLFMTVPMISPLNSTVMNVVLCLAGGAMFALGLGAASNSVLKKTSLV